MKAIYISLDSWGSYIKRPHHLVREISKLGIDTTYVESCPSLNRRIKFLLKNHFCRFSETKKIQDNLTILTIHLALPYHPSWLPGYLRNTIIHINKFLWTLIVKHYLRRYHGAEIVFFVSGLLTYPDLLLRSKAQRLKYNIIKTVYDCLDILEEFPQADKKVMSYWETRAIRHSDDVFVSAHALANRAVMRNAKRIHYVPNGVEFSRFQQAQKRSTIPQEIARFKKKGHYVLGYIGALDEWVDFAMMERMLKSDPKVLLCIIGKCISPRFKPNLESWLTSTKNEYRMRFSYLGAKPYQEIPLYVNSFDICLIPFKTSKLVTGVNPIKLYEYFACGKGVISTRWAEIAGFEDVISFVSDDNDIASAISNEIRRLKDRKIRMKRLRIAKSYDWHLIVKRAFKAVTGGN